LADEPLSPAKPGALQNLDAGCSGIPVRQSFGFGHDPPDAGSRRGDFPFPRDLDHCDPSTKSLPTRSRILYGIPNQSNAEQFDELYGRLWRAFFKADTEDLTQHERQLLHHIGSAQGVPLGVVARHLGIPKSSASEQVKGLERRGFLTRRRDPTDERRLSIVLTETGVARVTRDS